MISFLTKLRTFLELFSKKRAEIARNDQREWTLSLNMALRIRRGRVVMYGRVKKSVWSDLFWFKLTRWLLKRFRHTLGKATAESPSGKRPCFCLVVRLVDRLGCLCLLMSRFRPSRPSRPVSSTRFATHPK